MIRVTTLVFNQFTLIDSSSTNLYSSIITDAITVATYLFQREVQRGIQILLCYAPLICRLLSV